MASSSADLPLGTGADAQLTDDGMSSVTFAERAHMQTELDQSTSAAWRLAVATGATVDDMEL